MALDSNQNRTQRTKKNWKTYVNGTLGRILLKEKDQLSVGSLSGRGRAAICSVIRQSSAGWLDEELLMSAHFDVKAPFHIIRRLSLFCLHSSSPTSLPSNLQKENRNKNPFSNTAARVEHHAIRFKRENGTEHEQNAPSRSPSLMR